MAQFAPTHFSAATAAVTNQFVTSTNMKVGAYTVANSGNMPSAGARKITVGHTVVTGADTLGTITVVGKDLTGATITEVITPTSGGTATGTKYFAHVDSVTGAGWVINTGNDTIVVGCAAAAIVCEGNGVFHGITVNTTAAGTITFADANGTIAVLPSSVAVGNYVYDVGFKTFLSVTIAAGSDVTVEASWPANTNPASPYGQASATRAIVDPPKVAYVDSHHWPVNATYQNIFDKVVV